MSAAPEPTGIQVVAVIGGGTMGRGIAQVSAGAGYATALYDVEPEVVHEARAAIEETLEKGIDRGKVSRQEKAETLERLRLESDLAEAVMDADLVVEAIPEILEAKRELFGELDARCPTGTILASNTSSLPIAELAAATERPARVLGLHFFNPVHIMRLVEVVVTPDTGPDVRSAAVETVRRMGKEPIVVRDVPGFATSRLGLALGLEAMRMLEEGVASVADIDTAMELGYNHPMGPLRLTDLVGLDVRLAIADHLADTLSYSRFQPPEILRRLVAEGKLGKKTGEGFYRWEEGEAVPTTPTEDTP
ncbi:MAG: 3-hydroxyacyl-CoA dehydrogenase family protein [Gemmatimonadota bacterium]|nr:3-hydroxyacyl-CoA dehydrogenase family protein [Gemmatimonadota bacterium]